MDYRGYKERLIPGVHKRYERFSARSHEEVLKYLEEQFTYPESKRMA